MSMVLFFSLLFGVVSAQGLYGFRNVPLKNGGVRDEFCQLRVNHDAGNATIVPISGSSPGDYVFRRTGGVLASGTAVPDGIFLTDYVANNKIYYGLVRCSSNDCNNKTFVPINISAYDADTVFGMAGAVFSAKEGSPKFVLMVPKGPAQPPPPSNPCWWPFSLQTYDTTTHEIATVASWLGDPIEEGFGFTIDQNKGIFYFIMGNVAPYGQSVQMIYGISVISSKVELNVTNKNIVLLEHDTKTGALWGLGVNCAEAPGQYCLVNVQSNGTTSFVGAVYGVTTASTFFPGLSVFDPNFREFYFFTSPALSDLQPRNEFLLDMVIVNVDTFKATVIPKFCDFNTEGGKVQTCLRSLQFFPGV